MRPTEFAKAGLADNVPEAIGASGEWFTYQWLMRHLPDFTALNWVSEMKRNYLPDAPADTILNDLGADFRYHDRNGTITKSGRSELLFIEVKSVTQDAPQPFRMSINEWTRAQRCHESGGKEVYVVIVVTSINRKPQLSQLIIDPIMQIAQGKATTSISELVFTLHGE